MHHALSPRRYCWPGMFMAWLCFGIVLPGVAPTAFAQDRGSNVSLDVLLQDLQSPERAIRKKAEEQLRERKEEFLPELEQRDFSGTALEPEIQRIILEMQTSQAFTRMTGTRVRLTADHLRSLSQTVAAIEAQTGLPFDLQVPDAPDRPVRRRPSQSASLWWTIDNATHLTGTIWDWENSDTIRIVPGESRTPLSAIDYMGAVRLEARWESTDAAAEATSPKHSGPRRMLLQVDVEPGLTPFLATMNYSQIELTRNKQPVQQFDPDTKRELTFDTGMRVVFPVDFIWDEKQAAEGSQLKCTLNVRVAPRLGVLRFPVDAAVGSNQRAGQASASLLEMKRDAGVQTVKIRVRTNTDVKWDSYQLPLLHRRAWLEDSDGQRLPASPPEVVGQRVAVQTLTYRFPLGDDGDRWTTFCYAAPVVTLDLPFMFDLTVPDSTAEATPPAQ